MGKLTEKHIDEKAEIDLDLLQQDGQVSKSEDFKLIVYSANVRSNFTILLRHGCCEAKKRVRCTYKLDIPASH